MLKNVQLVIGLGFLWLFLFSIPVGKGRNFFDVAHFYVVDTAPVHWVVSKLDNALDVTRTSARNAGDVISEGMDDKLSSLDTQIGRE